MHIGTKTKKIDITKEKDTKLISQKLSKFIKNGDVIFLFGDIGVGKTTFIKYLINHFQKKLNEIISEVSSPTFNIVNEYKIKNFYIKHYDLYRVKNILELKNIGLFENNDKEILVIEWPELIKNKPKNLIELFFSYEQDYNKRSLVISADSRKEIFDEFKL